MEESCVPSAFREIWFKYHKFERKKSKRSRLRNKKHVYVIPYNSTVPHKHKIPEVLTDNMVQWTENGYKLTEK